MSDNDFRPATLIELHAVEAVPIPGRGLLHLIAGDSGIAEPDDLSGQDVLLDGALIHVAAVETFAIPRPYPPRLPFGLLVSTAPDPAIVAPLETSADWAGPIHWHDD